MDGLIIALIVLSIFVVAQLFLFEQPDNDKNYIDDGIDHCKDCEICSKENCRRCIYNKFNR